MRFEKLQHNSSQAQLALGGAERKLVLFTSKIIFIGLFSSRRGTVTILVVAKSVELFLGLHVGQEDEASHVLSTVLVGGVSEDGDADVVDPAIPEDREALRFDTTESRLFVFPSEFSS